MNADERRRAMRESARPSREHSMKTTRLSLHHLLLILCVLSIGFSPGMLAQQAAGKRPLTHDDYDSWRSIQGQRLSSDGKFLAYTLAPQDGDRELVVRNIAAGTDWRYVTGYVPPVTADQSDEEPSGDTPQPQGPSAQFTADGRALVFQVMPTKKEVETARREKKK